MYTEKSFQFPQNLPLSSEQIQVHLALYAGYIKNTNQLLAKLTSNTFEADPYTQAELQRRLGFEFDGMRLHEFYFEQISGQSTALPMDSHLGQLIQKQYASFDGYQAELSRLAAMRGIGWVITYYDAQSDSLLNAWVSDHELGHLAGLPIVLALDMWEHAFMVDFRPATKLEYIRLYLESVNWTLVAERLV